MHRQDWARRCSAIVIVIVASVGVLKAQGSSKLVEWLYIGGDQAHSKYSPLTDINKANVDDLEIAWEWDVGEMPLPEYGTRPGRFEATPPS